MREEGPCGASRRRPHYGLANLHENHYIGGIMNLELLRQVCVTPGAPGFEDKIRDFIIQEVAPLVDAVRVDNLGLSLIHI